MDILPNEILQDIFADVVLSVQEVEWKRDPYSCPAFIPISLGLVCKRWREITLITPFIWSFIVLNQDITKDQILLCLNRSNPIPAHLIFVSRRDTSRWAYDHNWMALKLRKFRTIMDNVLAPHFPRFQSIFYDIDLNESEFSVWFFCCMTIEREPLSLLTQLRIKASNTLPLDSVFLDGHYFPGGLPRLDYLELGPGHGCVPAWSCAQVAVLHLHLKERLAEHSFAILSRFQTLKSLFIYGNHPEYHSSILDKLTCLPFLHLTTLVFYDCNELPIPMLTMDCPKLEHVALLETSTTAVSTFRRLKEAKSESAGNFSTAKKLTTKFRFSPGQVPAQYDIDSIFTCFPDIQEAVLVGPGAELILQALAHPAYTKERWPNLQIIELERGATAVTLGLLYGTVNLRKDHIQIIRSDDVLDRAHDLELNRTHGDNLAGFRETGVRLERSNGLKPLWNQLSLPT